MYTSSCLSLTVILFQLVAVAPAQQLYSTYSSPIGAQDIFRFQDDRPPDCPPCFNCNLEDFACKQFANCTASSGQCSCPPGFAGVDCGDPTCGSLPQRDRAPREGQHCECDEGWEGINCNVCTTNEACNAFVPTGEDAVCYHDGLVVHENFQMCDITNQKILDQLKDQKPQATFSCEATGNTCNFQFWVDELESFYCKLDNCGWDVQAEENRNTTSYRCEKAKCSCVPGRILCGESGSVDIGDFLKESIKGPATFVTISSDPKGPSDGSKFDEPAMNDLISSIFGDPTITLACHAGECLHITELPGYERPIKKINTPLIAGIIAGCALFVAFTILGVWYLSRRSRRYGPIQLSEDDDEETAKLLADHKPAALHFEDVSYRLNSKEILSGISGAVHPGEIMAIMGASGAGKTTFLDILARKNKRGAIQGDIYINGERVPDEEYRSVIGFVDQEDAMLPTLTVHETIMDSAMLRLPREMSAAAKAQKVEDVERQLGIYHIRDQIIGSEESSRGISGGEKRRVGIACELVTSPSILFLDEPTSGLDAFNAFNVVECLVNLVKSSNRTVVFTIHQPRSNIVALFDQLILLAKGRTVYSGPFTSCQPYFDQIGYPCPAGFNIADYLVDLTMHAGAEHQSIEEDSSLFAPDGQGTRASSAIGVKSINSVINSISNQSVGEVVGSPPDSLQRGKGKRRSSIRQQQERQLFTRRKTDTADTPRGSSETGSPLDTPQDGNSQWLRLSKQQRPSTMDDIDNLPPAASGTGTNLDMLVQAYRDSDVARGVHEDTETAVTNAVEANNAPSENPQPNGSFFYRPNSNGAGKVKGFRKVGYLRQFLILSVRTWRNLYRNPMLMLTHYAVAIILAVLIGFFFYGLTDDIKGFQNRLGLFFFLLALFGFSTLTSLTTFAPERLLFVRERAKGYYSPLSYFFAKIIFDIVPLRLIPPLIMGSILYPMTGLLPAWPEFFKFILFLVLFNLAAAAICLFIGVIFGRNGGVANLIGSLVMLFSLLFSGFLLNPESLPKEVLWLQIFSIFHFGFEGLLVNEVRTLSLVDEKYGLNIEIPGAAILSTLGFNINALWKDAAGLAIFCGSFILLAYAVMHIFLIEKR